MRLDHFAHWCRDPRCTHTFYTRVLRLQLAQAYAGAELTLVYTLPGGGSLAFTTGHDQDAMALPVAHRADWARRHVGLTVTTRGEFDHWLERLREGGIDHLLIDDERIYFSDPDGLVLEIEVETGSDPDPSAEQALEQWLAS